MGLQETIRTEKRKKVAYIAFGMLSGQIDLIQGAREMCALKDVACPSEASLFTIFAVVESETDQFPLGASRALWATEYLKQLDSEREKYVADIQKEMLAACKAVLHKFDGPRK
jgi:hypothetical protein